MEEKKSKFLSFLVPYEDFNTTMKRLKEEHPKAVHHVYAYRYLNEFDQIVENSSDDGEPRGTSGKPCLNALAGADIINSAVIVVRYFGGIKLGTGGLVRAYGGATNKVILESQFEIFEKKQRARLSIAYNKFSQLEYLLGQHKISIVEKSFQSDVELVLEATTEEFMTLEKELPLGTMLNY